MKKKSFYPLIASLMVPMVFTACMEDIYNPEKTREIAPTENTLGISAKDGFDWNMMQSVNAVIVVTDDEDYNGTESLIEVFTTSPINNPQATPIAAGTAKKGSNLTTVLNLAKAADRIYVRQTDPRGRKEVYEFIVNGTNMVCKLGVQPKATQTRTTAKGYTTTEQNVVIPNHLAPENYPDGAIEITQDIWVSLDDAQNYVLKCNEYTQWMGGNGGGKATLYIPAGNYKITSVGTNANLVIMKGASVVIEKAELAPDFIRNYGELTLQGGFYANNNGNITEIYNEGTMTVDNNFNFGVNNILTNKGTLNLKGETQTNTRSVIYNAENATINAENKLEFVNTSLYNWGTVKALNTNNYTYWGRDEGYGEKKVYGNSILFNSNLENVINNYEGAKIEAAGFGGGATVNNDGLINIRVWDAIEAPSILNNSCTIIASDRLDVVNVNLYNGSITGPQDTEGKWQPVAIFSTGNNGIVTLKDGSIILADKMYPGNPSTFVGEGENTSLIKANTTTYTGGATFTDLALQLGIITKREDMTVVYTGCSLTEADSKLTIETCAGVIVDGNPGGEVTPPETPEISITQLTYAFEDQWPSYGDFDMNDVVLSVNKISADDKTFTIAGTLEAVGASKQIGVGVRLIGAQGKVANVTTGTLEDGQSDPTYIITANAHEFMGAGIQFINTKFGTQSIGGKPFEIKIDFNSAADATAMLDLKKIDFFIYYNTQQAGRQEVHIPGFAPTSKADNSYFNSGDDASGAKGYYLSRENLCWAVCIPSENGVWKWPFEFTPITDAYANFAAWITSNATESKDWYKTPVEDKYFK